MLRNVSKSFFNKWKCIDLGLINLTPKTFIIRLCPFGDWSQCFFPPLSFICSYIDNDFWNNYFQAVDKKAGTFRIAVVTGLIVLYRKCLGYVYQPGLEACSVAAAFSEIK